jgi:hypothetical protein
MLRGGYAAWRYITVVRWMPLDVSAHAIDCMTMRTFNARSSVVSHIS